MQPTSSLRAAFLILLAAGATGLAAPAHAQLVTNGGFENYVVQSDGSSNYFTGWTLSGNVNRGLDADTFVFGAPHSGDLDAWLGAPDSDGFLTQSITTTPGQAYTVSYWLASDAPAITSISLGSGLSPFGDPAAFNDFSASFGGQTLFSQTNLDAAPGPPDPSDYTLYSFTAIATSAASTLQFGFRNDESWFHLDDVSVTPAAVPEASTTISFGLLLALGTGAAVLRTRRRRQAE